MSTLSFARQVPVRHEVDVMVAGGGPAGVAAAVAAARQGASVFLAEGQASFGGMGTCGMIPAFMEFADGEHFTAAGLGREVYDRLWDYGGAGPDDKRNSPYCHCSIRAEVLKRVYDDLVTAEKKIGFSFLTQVIGIECEGDVACGSVGRNQASPEPQVASSWLPQTTRQTTAPGRVSHAICHGKSGLFAVRAGVFVDATGDGDLAAWAGAPFEKGDPAGTMMPGTLCSLYADIDWPTVRASKPNVQEALDRAFADKVFSKEDRHLSGIWRTGEHTGGGNIGHLYGIDGTDERSMTEGMLWGRKSLMEFVRFYRGYLKGYERMELIATGSLPGIRETRRVLGDYVLCLDDFHKRAVFEDEIGRYAYPVDIHPSGANQAAYAKFLEEWTNLRYKAGENYGLPYRCLTPRGLENLLVAGRCISADRHMQSSLRVMPCCYVTGQAAGTAAVMALSAAGRARAVNVKELQGRLKAAGAYLPNC